MSVLMPCPPKLRKTKYYDLIQHSEYLLSRRLSMESADLA